MIDLSPHPSNQERVRSEYEETLMKQRALFDEEIVTLTEEMRDEAKVGFSLQSPCHPDHRIIDHRHPDRGDARRG